MKTIVADQNQVEGWIQVLLLLINKQNTNKGHPVVIYNAIPSYGK